MGASLGTENSTFTTTPQTSIHLKHIPNLPFIYQVHFPFSHPLVITLFYWRIQQKEIGPGVGQTMFSSDTY